MKVQVEISSDGQITKVNTPDGLAVHGVRKAVVTMEAGKATMASLELISRFTGPAEAEFSVRDPTSGLLKQVDRIHFADGTTFPPHD